MNTASSWGRPITSPCSAPSRSGSSMAKVRGTTPPTPKCCARFGTKVLNAIRPMRASSRWACVEMEISQWPPMAISRPTRRCWKRLSPISGQSSRTASDRPLQPQDVLAHGDLVAARRGAAGVRGVRGGAHPPDSRWAWCSGRPRSGSSRRSGGARLLHGLQQGLVVVDRIDHHHLEEVLEVALEQLHELLAELGAGVAGPRLQGRDVVLS